ncbi:MAG: DUF1127 domain-containing protein [Beijerinckiaceae bacterium]|nr:DUF1127 domain-containing protein [Beijerinckiaceae bacterium]
MAIVPGFITALLLSAVKGVVQLHTAMANRRAAKELLNWDSRSLKDIGLTRGDVRGALAESLVADPTLSLSLIAAGRDTRPRRDGAVRPSPIQAEAVSKDRLGILPSAEPALCA